MEEISASATLVFQDKIKTTLAYQKGSRPSLVIVKVLRWQYFQSPRLVTYRLNSDKKK